jgi:hypothetical protein
VNRLPAGLRRIAPTPSTPAPVSIRTRVFEQVCPFGASRMRVMRGEEARAGEKPASFHGRLILFESRPLARAVFVARAPAGAA